MYVYAVFCMLFPIGPFYNQHKRFHNRAPQLILDDKGIQITSNSGSRFMPDTYTTQYYTWEEIGGEYVDKERVGRTMISHLKFDNPNGNVKFAINSLAIEQDYLNQLLVYYRELSGKKYKYYA